MHETSEHGLSHPFKGTGAVANGFNRDQKLFGEVCVHFHLELNILEPLNVPTDKKYTGTLLLI
jgi:hypothetical protein